jgi:oxygen-independent coproporphyrinogen-3 oxidase
MAEQTLGATGYDHYEISNWCKPQRECAHNLIYWRNEPYIGLGAGAHSSSVNRRWWRVRRPAEYIVRAEQRRSTIMDDELIDARASRGETMMLGLRLLNEGVEHARFAARYGAPPSHFFAAELARAEQDGLISIDAERILLTGRGRFVSNSVMRMFV